jgi:hypothetical protein
VSLPKVRIDTELLAECVTRAGWLRGPRIASYAAQWAILQADLHREPTSDEFGAYWEISRRTAFRRLSEFREAFPELGPDATPSVVVQATRGTGPARASARLAGVEPVTHA